MMKHNNLEIFYYSLHIKQYIFFLQVHLFQYGIYKLHSCKNKTLKIISEVRVVQFPDIGL